MVPAAAHKGPNASCCSLARVAQIRVVSRGSKQSHHLHPLFTADQKSVLVGVRLRKVLPYYAPCPGSCHSCFHGTARIMIWNTFLAEKEKNPKARTSNPSSRQQRVPSCFISLFSASTLHDSAVLRRVCDSWFLETGSCFVAKVCMV